MIGVLRSLSRNAKQFAVQDSGVAAVEMAFIMPVALGFLSVAVAGGQSLTLYHKTVLTAHSVTDIVSRSPYQTDPNNATAEQLSKSDLDTDLGLSQYVFYPADSTNLTVVMSELQVNATTNQGTLVWSEGVNGGVALSCGTTISLDPSLAQTGAKYILYGQVTYNFQPLGGILALPPITLSASEMLTIRNAPQITVPSVQTQC